VSNDLVYWLQVDAIPSHTLENQNNIINPTDNKIETNNSILAHAPQRVNMIFLKKNIKKNTKCINVLGQAVMLKPRVLDLTVMQDPSEAN
jgi:hypothetical protein